MSIVSLIGYRGSGKTTLARDLASVLGYSWIDIDQELQRREGRTIREIFATDGEVEFRRLERLLIQEYGRSDQNMILATGGGAILNAETRTDLRAWGPVLWLTATPEELARRIYADPQTLAQRPNLTVAGGLEEIRQVLAARDAFYRNTAHHIIPTDGLSSAEVCRAALEAVQQTRDA